MSSMLSAPATIPAHQRGDLQPGVGALVARHAHVLTGQACKPSRIGEPKHRARPADATKFGSSNAASVAKRV